MTYGSVDRRSAGHAIAQCHVYMLSWLYICRGYKQWSYIEKAVEITVKEMGYTALRDKLKEDILSCY